MKRLKSGICLPGQAAQISRRALLETGISMTSYMTLSQLLGHHQARAQSFTVRKNLVWVALTGGWDILEATDPKVSSTSGIDMIYDWTQANTLAGASDDDRIGRWLPNLAAIGEDTVVVRGMAMGTTAHDAGQIYMDTGVLSNGGNVNAASIPAIVASESDATIPIIQLDGGMEPLTDRGLLNPVSVVRAQNLALYQSMYPESNTEKTLRLRMLEYLQDSASDLEREQGTNDRLSSVIDAESKIRNQIEADVGEKLSVSSADVEPFTVGAPDNLDTRMAEAFALTAKLIRNDIVNCVNLGIGGFDTHANQSQSLQPTMESLDWIVRTFADQLRAAGKLDDTLIVLFSDFGRTPKINNRNGRDHWPVGGAMLIGGGIQGGRIVGGTDDDLLARNVNMSTGEIQDSGEQLNPTHLCGSVLELALGSDYLPYRSYLEAIPALTMLKE